jgi:aconitate hydratase 2/2-methylisocitrate dehydratase
MLEAYRQHVAERAALGIPPLPLNAKQTEQLVELLKNPPKGEEDLLVELITFRVPPGVDDAAKVKASFLAAVAEGSVASPLVSRAKATELLGTMLGGYNVKPLIDLLDDAEVGGIAAEGLKKTLLVFDFFHDVQVLAEAATPTPRACCKAGPMPNGSPAVRKWKRKSPLPYSRCRAKPTPTTCRRHRTPGAARTSRCTTWPC